MKTREEPTKIPDEATGERAEGAKRKEKGLVPTGDPVTKGNLRSERVTDRKTPKHPETAEEVA